MKGKKEKAKKRKRTEWKDTTAQEMNEIQAADQRLSMAETKAPIAQNRPEQNRRECETGRVCVAY